MTVDEIRARVEEIRKVTYDDEEAHIREDALHQQVLAAIAGGECDDPAACAGAALETLKIEFGRWFA